MWVCASPDFEYHCCTGGCLPMTGALREMLFVVVYLTLTDPLRIQPWSQDRGNQTKSSREQFRRKKSRESRHKRNGQGSSQLRTSSPGRNTQEAKNKVKVWVCASPEAQRVSHVPRWAGVPLLLFFFLIPLRHRWGKCCCTLRTHQLVGTMLLYRLYATTRRLSNSMLLYYTGYNLLRPTLMDQKKSDRKTLSF